MSFFNKTSYNLQNKSKTFSHRRICGISKRKTRWIHLKIKNGSPVTLQHHQSLFSIERTVTNAEETFVSKKNVHSSCVMAVTLINKILKMYTKVARSFQFCICSVYYRTQMDVLCKVWWRHTFFIFFFFFCIIPFNSWTQLLILLKDNSSCSPVYYLCRFNFICKLLLIWAAPETCHNPWWEKTVKYYAVVFK